jgi:hypothetical protein
VESEIGERFTNSSAKRWRAVGIAVLAVAFDLLIVICGLDPQYRSAVALISFALMVYVADGDLSALGLRPSPKQGWVLWVRLSLVIGATVAVCIAVGFALWTMAGYRIPIYVTSPENLVGGFFLAWAFLKSETILMPWLLHAVGNGIVLAAQVAGWYWLASGA